jgi:hypothetical protein
VALPPHSASKGQSRVHLEEVTEALDPALPVEEVGSVR